MSTVRDILKDSLRKIGVIAAGETPPAEDLVDARRAMNALIESWSNEHLMIPSKVRETFTLTANDGTITFGGAGQDITTSRPMRVEQASIAIDNQEFALRILTKEEWADVSLKTTTSDIPLFLYPEMTDTFITMNLWPVPSAANTLVLYTWKPLTTYTSLTTTLTLPPGYERALIYNLALEMAPEFGVTPSQLVYETAKEAKGNIRRLNSTPYFLQCDPGVRPDGQYYNWWTGGYE